MSDHLPKNILVDVGFQGLLVTHFVLLNIPWIINNLDEILRLVYLMPSLIVVLLGLFKRTEEGWKNRVNGYRGLTKGNSWSLLKISIFVRYILYRPQIDRIILGKSNHKSQKCYSAVWTTLSIHFLLLDCLILYKNPSVHRICTQ